MEFNSGARDGPGRQLCMKHAGRAVCSMQRRVLRLLESLAIHSHLPTFLIAHSFWSSQLAVTGSHSHRLDIPIQRSLHMASNIASSSGSSAPLRAPAPSTQNARPGFFQGASHINASGVFNDVARDQYNFNFNNNIVNVEKEVRQLIAEPMVVYRLRYIIGKRKRYAYIYLVLHP
jgi:hypothetical protein